MDNIYVIWTNIDFDTHAHDNTDLQYYTNPCTAGKIQVWVGQHAAAHQVEMAEELGRRLAARLPAELGQGDSATLATVHSGAESADFWAALGGDRELFNKAASQYKQEYWI